jgi:RND family efflux transporter MFP subunit
MKVHRGILLLAILLLANLPARAADSAAPSPLGEFAVCAAQIADQKAAFATVESLNVVPARARIGGTVVTLDVRNGDAVQQGQVLAVVGDQKLALQMMALDAQIAGAQSQLLQAQADLARADTLFREGSGPRVTLDQARTAFQVATSTLRARTAEREVIRQNMAEGEVLAPATGRVLDVPVTRGTVVLGGDTLATVAERSYVLRLRVPERHAAFLRAGDPVRIDGAELGGDTGPGFGRITLVYPRIEEGRVVADAVVPDLPDRFVGARLRVWIAAGSRPGLVVPDTFLVTRFGLDTVRLRRDGGAVEVSVQRGQPHPTPDMPNGIEILSGLRAGDVLVKP